MLARHYKSELTKNILHSVFNESEMKTLSVNGYLLL